MKLVRYPHPLLAHREWESLLAPLLHSVRREGLPQSASPGVEWYEDDTHFHARIELPGVKRDQLRLDAEEGLLRLSRERVSGEGEGSRTSRSEWVVRCPEGGRSHGVEARLADGILHVSLPKMEIPQPLNIEIQ